MLPDEARRTQVLPSFYRMIVRHQQLHMAEAITPPTRPLIPPAVLTRSQRAHYRLSWRERLARNARANTADQLTFQLFGIPESFACWLGFIS